MATAVHLPHPERGLAWVREQSTASALTILGLSITALALVIIGTPVVLALHGFTPVDALIAGLKSPELRGVLLVSLALGLAASVLGWSSYRRMPTKISRGETVSGAVLAMQGAVLAAFFLWFVSGDVEDFARGFLDFEVITPFVGDFLNGAKNTLFLALTSEALGVVLGLVLALFAISQRAVVRAPARAYINFFRGTPLIWQLIFIGIGIPIALGINIPTYQAGILAFSLNMGAYSAEVFRAGIQSVERGQLEAARGLGMSYLQAMQYAVVPQAVRRVIPPLMNEFVILIKDTALIIVLGLTAAQRDLMTVGDQLVSNTFNTSFYVATGLGYLAISLPLIRLVNALERRLRSGLIGVGA